MDNFCRHNANGLVSSVLVIIISHYAYTLHKKNKNKNGVGNTVQECKFGVCSVLESMSI